MVFTNLERGILLAIARNYGRASQLSISGNKVKISREFKSYLSYLKRDLIEWRGRLFVHVWREQAISLKGEMVKRYPELNNNSSMDRYMELFRNSIRELLWRF